MEEKLPNLKVIIVSESIILENIQYIISAEIQWLEKSFVLFYCDMGILETNSVIQNKTQEVYTF